MQIFGISLWRILLCIALIIIVVKRASLVALFASKYIRKGDFAQALKIYRIANKVGNLNVQNRLGFCYLLLRNGLPDEAQTELLKLIPYTKTASAERYRLKNLMALTYWKQGNLPYAIEELEEVIEANFKNTLIYQNLGILYNLSDDKEKALAFNKEAYEYNSDDNIITDNLADAYHMNGNLEKASELYEELLAREPEPKFPEAYYGYGRVLIKLGKKEEGIALIEKALDKTFSYLSIKTKDEVKTLLNEYKD